MDRTEQQSKWQAFKSMARQQWEKLSDDDLEKVSGNEEKFLGLLGEKYGFVRARAAYEIQQFRRAYAARLSASR
jgi:uncharacterized protein YjbJ (UPF0337 family)